MDVLRRVEVQNAKLAFILVFYFFLQGYSGICRYASFIAFVPVAKKYIDVLVLPSKSGYADEHPGEWLLRRFWCRYYGVWVVLLGEAVHRMVKNSIIGGCVSMMIMLAFLVGYVLSISTGVCRTNVKVFYKDSTGFKIVSWVQLYVAFLMGSGWTL